MKPGSTSGERISQWLGDAYKRIDAVVVKGYLAKRQPLTAVKGYLKQQQPLTVVKLALFVVNFVLIGLCFRDVSQRHVAANAGSVRILLLAENWQDPLAWTNTVDDMTRGLDQVKDTLQKRQVDLELWTRNPVDQRPEWKHGRVSLRQFSGWYGFWHLAWHAPEFGGAADSAPALIVTDAAKVTSDALRAWLLIGPMKDTTLDVAGISFEPRGIWELKNNEFVFRQSADGPDAPKFYLYRYLHPTTMFAPASAEVWRAFQGWFYARRASWFLWPVMSSLKKKDDQSWNQYIGTEVAPWSLWITRFAMEHNVFFLYPSSNASLSVDGVRWLAETGLSRLDRYDNKGKAIFSSYDVATEMLKSLPKDETAVLIDADDSSGVRSWQCSLKAMKASVPARMFMLRTHGVDSSMLSGSDVVVSDIGTSAKRAELIAVLLKLGRPVVYFENNVVSAGDLFQILRDIHKMGAQIIANFADHDYTTADFVYLAPYTGVQRIWAEVLHRLKLDYAQGASANAPLIPTLGSVVNGSSFLLHGPVTVSPFPHSVPVLSAEQGCINANETVAISGNFSNPTRLKPDQEIKFWLDFKKKQTLAWKPSVHFFNPPKKKSKKKL